jgi:hypothetical protein
MLSKTLNNLMELHSLDMIILLLPLWVGRRSSLVPRMLRARNEPMLGRHTTSDWAPMQLRQDSHQDWELIQGRKLLLMGNIRNKFHNKTINGRLIRRQDILVVWALPWELTSHRHRTS